MGANITGDGKRSAGRMIRRLSRLFRKERVDQELEDGPDLNHPVRSMTVAGSVSILNRAREQAAARQ